MLKVTNLPVPTTESDLNQLFSGYGKIHIVSIEIIDDQSIAYVELENDKDEQDAIKQLNKSEWRGNYIYVDTFRGDGGNPDDPGRKNNKPEKQDTSNEP